MARGVTWVKFLIKFSRAVPTESGALTAIRLHSEWLADVGPRSFQYGAAVVKQFNFDNDKAVFTFKTEPYSMKSNDYYRYIFEFGNWAEARIAGTTTSGQHIQVTGENTPSIVEKTPVVKIDSEMKVRSFISRIIN